MPDTKITDLYWQGRHSYAITCDEHGIVAQTVVGRHAQLLVAEHDKAHHSGPTTDAPPVSEELTA